MRSDITREIRRQRGPVRAAQIIASPEIHKEAAKRKVGVSLSRVRHIPIPLRPAKRRDMHKNGDAG